MGNLLSLDIFENEVHSEEDIIPENSNSLIEQYAFQVLDFSSQYGSDRSFSYTARNCLEKPSKFPSYGDFPQTFVMRTYGKWNKISPRGLFCNKIRESEQKTEASEFIDLHFEKPVFVNAVYVYETLNPGSIVEIWAGNCHGKWKRLWRGHRGRVGHQPRQFGPPIDQPSFLVNQLRLHFDGIDLPYHAAIDAVCLLGTTEPPTYDLEIGSILYQVIDMNLHLSLANFESLQVDRIPPSSDNGYFDYVPREAMLQIFQYLDFHSLIRCGQVSRLFRHVSRDPLLYMKLKLKPWFNIICDSTLIFLLQKALYMKYLDLSWCGNYGKVTPDILRKFIYARGARLNNLLLSNCHVANRDVLVAVARTCLYLVDLDLSNCHVLNTGTFGVLSMLGNLTQLNVYRTEIGNNELKLIITNNQSLKCLNIGACSNIIGDDICNCLSLHCKQLLAVDFWRCQSLTARGVLTLASITSLEELDLGWCINILASTGCIRSLVNNCRRLKKLFLTAHRQTSDADIEAVAALLGPRLHQFNIMGSSNVTSGSILTMAKSCPELTLLDIGYCIHLENSEFQREMHMLLPKCHIVTSLNGY